MIEEFVDLETAAGIAQLATRYVAGDAPPIVFLHGFGGSKEEYVDIAGFLAARHSLLLYDHPGCGASAVERPEKVDVPLLGECALGLMRYFGFGAAHLVGHSMGGLTAAKIAQMHPERVLSLTSIEGNLSPEDCSISRLSRELAHLEPDAFLAAVTSVVGALPGAGWARYAADLKHRVTAAAAAPLLASILGPSEEEPLLADFIALEMPKLFVYGAENAGFSYIPALRKSDAELAEIAHANHFPMLTNPAGMFRAIADFIAGVEAARSS